MLSRTSKAERDMMRRRGVLVGLEKQAGKKGASVDVALWTRLGRDDLR